MACRTYFYTTNGQEIDTPLSGHPWAWLGAGLTTGGNQGDQDQANPLWTDDQGRIARTEISISIRGRERFVTIADFPGQEAVQVKIWGPDRRPEWFWLHPGPTRVVDAHRARKGA